MIPTFLVSLVARKNVIVSLSGDGGDELFGGYIKYKHFKLVRHQNFLRPISKLLSLFIKKPVKLYRYLLYSKLKEYEQYANLSSYNYIEDLKIKDLNVYEPYKNYFKYKNWIFNIINTDLHTYLPEDILTKVDRASLANSLESRPPFLDHELIELACSISPKLKIKDGETKYILKKSLAGILPKRIIYRKKKGFGSPIKHYFKKELKDIIIDKVIKFKEHNYFNDLDPEKMLEMHIKGEKDYSRVLWTMLMFNIWWERWMK
jgi:asparagine synthase (glutamine-hydrolysing)